MALPKLPTRRGFKRIAFGTASFFLYQHEYHGASSKMSYEKNLHGLKHEIEEVMVTIDDCQEHGHTFLIPFFSDNYIVLGKWISDHPDHILLESVHKLAREYGSMERSYDYEEDQWTERLSVSLQHHPSLK